MVLLATRLLLAPDPETRAMDIYGHPWSINTRKVLMTLAEKNHEARLVPVLVPAGEQKLPAHLARHPFGKVPVLDDDGFVLYETSAITRYLDRKLSGPPLTPADAREAARFDQWISIADAYFIPHAHPLIVETLFRRYLGGPQDTRAIEAGREGMQLALDTIDRWLSNAPWLAGTSFSLADIHWMPYFEYLVQTGQGEHVTRREHLAAWWDRASSRATWQRVARSGPQPYAQDPTAAVATPA
jgi:glutathione S-transferase